MKKKMKEMSRRRELSSMYGIDRLSQQTSRASGAQSVSQQVESLLCCVCAQTAAPHRELNDTKPAFITHLSLDKMWRRSFLTCQSRYDMMKHLTSISVVQISYFESPKNVTEAATSTKTALGLHKRRRRVEPLQRVGYI